MRCRFLEGVVRVCHGWARWDVLVIKTLGQKTSYARNSTLFTTQPIKVVMRLTLLRARIGLAREGIILFIVQTLQHHIELLVCVFSITLSILLLTVIIHH